MGKGIRIRNSLGMCLRSSRYKIPPGPSCTVPIFDGSSHRAVDPIHDMLQNVRENSAWICRPYQLLNFHDSGPSLEDTRAIKMHQTVSASILGGSVGHDLRWRKFLKKVFVSRPFGHLTYSIICSWSIVNIEFSNRTHQYFTSGTLHMRADLHSTNAVSLNCLGVGRGMLEIHASPRNRIWHHLLDLQRCHRPTVQQWKSEQMSHSEIWFRFFKVEFNTETALDVIISFSSFTSCGIE